MVASEFTDDFEPEYGWESFVSMEGADLLSYIPTHGLATDQGAI